MFMIPPNSGVSVRIYALWNSELTDGNVGPIDALLAWFCGDTHFE